MILYTVNLSDFNSMAHSIASGIEAELCGGLRWILQANLHRGVNAGEITLRHALRHGIDYHIAPLLKDFESF